VVEENTAEGASANGVLRNPNRQTGGEQLSFVMRSVGMFTNVFILN